MNMRALSGEEDGCHDAWVRCWRGRRASKNIAAPCSISAGHRTYRAGTVHVPQHREAGWEPAGAAHHLLSWCSGGAPSKETSRPHASTPYIWQTSRCLHTCVCAVSLGPCICDNSLAQTICETIDVFLVQCNLCMRRDCLVLEFWCLYCCLSLSLCAQEVMAATMRYCGMGLEYVHHQRRPLLAPPHFPPPGPGGPPGLPLGGPLI